MERLLHGLVLLHLFVFHASPETLAADVIQGPPGGIHRDANRILQSYFSFESGLVFGEYYTSGGRVAGGYKQEDAEGNRVYA